MSFEEDPDHPIIDSPWNYQLIEFVYHRDHEWTRSYIDMVLEQEGVVRRLRFFGPQSLKLSEGLPNCSGMCILDIRGRQMEGLGVRVCTFEAAWGVPCFWASRVVDLDQEGL
jgi:hypothetical protein